MKPGIHPAYRPVVFRDATTGEQFLTKSTADSDKQVVWTNGNTYPLITVDVTSASHPFWTGTARIVDTAGQVEKFNRRYGQRKRAI
ncbi:type B 50S ribosomal protein L31 [Nakamurella antarctica]|uniref:Large ribosomal subunit protein bL31B n=1 Tax=Nakamurella antarctica TaxID=1902245 RepID=A0A3G8ZZI4_9ACTN|nr:type B 50S ribosomal protein L31 [Nakamurella antarctica]AZI58961.1 type B 50S ribosomal protein L31 [Nakamurella antarctica]